ncbi:MAG: patatin-like protein [Parerythrobacter sp.]
MRQKELRIALVCYGGVSLAIYMHGVTKEIWKLARASRDFHRNAPASGGVEAVYRDLLAHIEEEHELRLRVLPDILSGASAGGINAVFLAQAIHSGHSLEPLTDMWLDNADVDKLVDPSARPMWRYAKFWTQPFAWWVFNRPETAFAETVSPETRGEVRRKVAGLIRGRWFEPPFSGSGFSTLLHDAFTAIAATPAEAPLLPPGHPVSLFVTATDFHGFAERLRLNSPPFVLETEHRLSMDFEARTPAAGGTTLDDPWALTMAARATASFPGAFPPFRIAEIDQLAHQRRSEWHGRDAFLAKVMPVHSRRKALDTVSLIDGSVLVNKPFDSAIKALQGRPAQREVDRRFVYIDPRPDRSAGPGEDAAREVGFFGAIFGSLSTIPREQPIRDNLDVLERQSREAERLQAMVSGLRPEIEAAVERLFGRTLLLDRPTPRRLANWRSKAQQAAARAAGFAYSSYAQVKFTAILDELAGHVMRAEKADSTPRPRRIVAAFRAALAEEGLEQLGAPKGGADAQAIAFFRAHDLGFRLRRLRLLTRRLSRDWDADPTIDDAAVDDARVAIYEILALYFDSDKAKLAGPIDAIGDAAGALDMLASASNLVAIDTKAEAMLSRTMQAMPQNLRRLVLLTYLGFPYYDIATLPLMRHEGLTEFDPVKVDRISPDDARSIRQDGARATLRGTEFYNFGAFFSRAYRENDYLWGRLHGAERMIDLVCSTLPDGLPDAECRAFKKRAFLAILDVEEDRFEAGSDLTETIRAEVNMRL